MKILIAGLAKTGTSGLLYLIANSFEERPALAFEPIECPAEIAGSDADAVVKVLIGDKLNVASFSGFDRKITLVRDPRDRIISSILYSQYHANYLADEEKVARIKACLERKEASPGEISVVAILDAIGTESNIQNEAQKFSQRIKKTLDWFENYVQAVPDGFFYKYEDFVSGNYAPLENYLGMEIAGKAEVPDSLSRVERTKSYGDWRHWFTAEDIKMYRPMLTPWLEKYGYVADDWELSPTPTINREHCSGYFLRIVDESRKRAVTQPVSCPVGIGYVDLVTPKAVAGWASWRDSRSPVVELLINGILYGETTTDRMRKDVFEKGLHETGLCGFRFELGAGAIRPGDLATVRIKGETAALAGSRACQER